MEKQKKITSLVIGLVLISLIGILIIQAYWLNKAIDTNKEIFQQKVDLASKNVSEAYRNTEGLPNRVHQYIIDQKNKDDIGVDISSIIDSAFNEVNLPLTYTYGLYTHKNRKNNEMMFGNANELVLENSTCNQKAGRTFGWTNLTCNMNYGKGNDYHLAIFPSYSSFIFNEVKWTVLTSVLFILLIIAGFIYMLRVIRKQTKLSALKNDFINNLTHEFKTPLFSISLASKALRKKYNHNISNETKPYFDVIDVETHHLKNQVEKILQLSMIDSGRLHLEKEKIDVHEQLQMVAKSFNIQLSEKKGNISFNLNASNSFIFGDKQYLNNVWYNIFDNAIKYNNEFPHLKIETKETDNDFIEIFFIDNGIGIKKESQKMIFDRFYRETNGDIYNTKGFGVGLSYVTEILKLHDSTIMLTHSSKSGSCFKISFPKYE